MKLCSVTQSTHSHSPPTRLLMLREKLSTYGFLMLCTYSFTFSLPICPSEATPARPWVCKPPGDASSHPGQPETLLERKPMAAQLRL